MKQIKQVKLGSQGLVVPAIGLGCMGMSNGQENTTVMEVQPMKNKVSQLSTVHLN